MIRAAVIAPHLDDAALSCWHQIDQAGSETITVFAGIPDSLDPSWWDRLAGQSDAQKTMQLRRAENSAALANTPTVITNLDLLDRPYIRGERDIPAIADAIDANVQSDSPLIVAAGIGTLMRRHPDHTAVRQAGIKLHESGRDATFYADIPYALPIRTFDRWPERLPIERIKRLLDTAVEIEPVELSDTQQERKRAVVTAFTSQFKMVNMLALGALKKSAAYKWEALIHCV